MAMLVPLAMMLLQKRDQELKGQGNQYVKTPSVAVPRAGTPQQQMLGAASAKSLSPQVGGQSPLQGSPESDGIVRQDPYTLGTNAHAPAALEQTAVLGQTSAPGPAMQTWGNAGADRPDLDYYGGIYHRSPWEDGGG